MGIGVCCFVVLSGVVYFDGLYNIGSGYHGQTPIECVCRVHLHPPLGLDLSRIAIGSH